jgi:hypothetical protein
MSRRTTHPKAPKGKPCGRPFTSAGQRQKYKEALQEFRDGGQVWLSARRVQHLYGWANNTLHGWVKQGVPLLPGFRLRTRREPLGPDGQKLTFFPNTDLDAIQAAMRDAALARPVPDEKTIEEAAQLLGCSRAVVFLWIRDGMPFWDRCKLPCVTRMTVDSLGRPNPRTFITIQTIQEVIRRRDARDPRLVPAHEAQRQLKCSRAMLDYLRRRGVLTGVHGQVFRGNLVRNGWSYYHSQLEDYARHRAERIAAKKGGSGAKGHHALPPRIELAKEGLAEPGATDQDEIQSRRNRGGRPLQKATREVYQFCYEQYLNPENKVAHIRHLARVKFGDKLAPKQNGHVTTYARRWAERNGLLFTTRS